MNSVWTSQFGLIYIIVIVIRSSSVCSGISEASNIKLSWLKKVGEIVLGTIVMSSKRLSSKSCILVFSSGDALVVMLYILRDAF